MMTDFIHLHVASCFSAHHGTSWPEALVEAQEGSSAAALTDKDGMYGIVRHIRACVEHKISPIAGADLLIGDDEVTILAHGHDKGEGWASLCRLISSAHHAPIDKTHHGSAHRTASLTHPRIKTIATGADGPAVTVLLGPNSDVGKAVLRKDSRAATALLNAWQKLLPGNIAIEIVCHWTEPGEPASLPHAADMLKLALAAGVPTVITNAVRYLTPADAVTADLLDAAGMLLPLGAFPSQPNAQAWLKSPREMEDVASAIVSYADESPDILTRLFDDTQAIAARCLIDPGTDLGWRKPKVPELVTLGLSGDPLVILTKKCRVAIPDRYPRISAAQKRQLAGRLDSELATIRAFGFATYFLTVADVVDLIHRMDIRVQARGSGVGSLVNYLLGISVVDPMEHGLLFERFLGSARTTLPDIDIDVESARRHDIYRAVTKRYGEHRVALLSMQNQYRAKGAVRDVGLALGLPEDEIDQIAKSLWGWGISATDIPAVLAERCPKEFTEKIGSDKRMRALIDLTGRLDRLPRHISMHPCGVILSDDSLLSTTPTQPSGLGLAMSQFDKDDIDDIGLLKLDILGIRMQSAMAYTLKEIDRISGEDHTVDLDGLPHDDEATFQNICTAQTLGMYQIESPGQHDLVGKIQPDCMEDLIADTSLFRPGPMRGNMITPFINAKHGHQNTPQLHPSFQFLADSHGVVIYHEHVIRILHECMGVSFTQADEIRRHLRKDASRIEAEFRRCTMQRRDENGERIFTDQQIDLIWATLHGFGSFGFCKAHAAASAITTYQSAWLKTHYPAEFIAGLLEYDPGMHPKSTLMAEARRIGVPILDININSSTDHYHVEAIADTAENAPVGVRRPFTEISGISGVEVRRLVAHQPYSSMTDVLVHARPSRPILNRLAASGAMDALMPDSNRRDVISRAHRLTARASHLMPPANQEPLFV